MAGLLLWLSQSVTSCASYTRSHCWPCQSRCSEGLTCHPEFKRCYDPNEGYTCEADEDETGATEGSGGGGVAVGSGGQSSVAAGGQPAESTGVTTGGDGVGGAAGAAVASDSTRLECGPDACQPQFITSGDLPGVCAGDFIELRLQARCACDAESVARTFHFTSNDLPDGLSLSLDGVLRGTVPSGDSAFNVHVAIDSGEWERERSFTFRASDRCFLLYAAENLETGTTELVAHWLGEPASEASDQVLAPGDVSETEFSSFDLSKNGRFVALVSASAAGEQLSLFRLRGHQVEPITINGLESGLVHVAHAFSRDSNWLALISAEPDDPEATSLHLVRLADDTVEVIDSAEVEYASGLVWSDIDNILYFGGSTVSDNYLRALEYAFDEQGLLDRTVFSSSRVARGANDFRNFVVGPGGFMGVYQGSPLFYYDRVAGEFLHPLPLPRSVSPALDWYVRGHTVGARLDPLAQSSDAEPLALAEHCSWVMAWSLDGSKLLCHEDWVLYVYDVNESGGTLAETRLFPADEVAPESHRVAFSASGNWLALTPTAAGLVVVQDSDYATHALEPLLEAPEGTNEWDFFFTSKEDRLIVQRGRQLYVAQLTLGEPNPTFQPVDATLPAVPDCNRSWAPEPANWCGSPMFRGNLVLSADEEKLAFASEDRTVQVVTLDATEPVTLRKRAESCSQNCVQFQ